jgi:hypothetical protein
MNCQEFQEIVQDLARARAMEASKVESGMGHAHACAACAEKLEEERSLAEALGMLAQSAGLQQAPPQVEDFLLGAFREQHKAARHARLWRFAWVAGTAAAVLAVSLSLSPWWPGTKPEGETLKQMATSAPPEPPAESVVASVREEPASVAISKRAGPRVAPRNELDTFAEGFVPLPYADTYGPLEAGEIVRVRLGSAALESLGFAVTWPDVGEPVLADVLVGQDGLPRAVRLVE